MNSVKTCLGTRDGIRSFKIHIKLLCSPSDWFNNCLDITVAMVVQWFCYVPTHLARKADCFFNFCLQF